MLTHADTRRAATLPERRRILALGLLGGLVLLAGRLVQLQHAGAEMRSRAERQITRVEVVPARPGDILDARGRLLATTISAESLFLDPSLVEDPWSTAQALARLLALDADRLFERIVRHHDRRFLWVRRRLAPEEAAAVRQLAEGHPELLPANGYGFRTEFLRVFPQGPLAAHVIGLRDIDGVGRGGIEMAYDDVLRGIDGRRVVVRDAHGRTVSIREEESRLPQHGRSVLLTLDAVVQLYAEQELAGVVEQWRPTSACALVMDARTGEILAMASRPTFDPNEAAAATPDAWTNRAISDQYEPGSTFKPFVVIEALERGVVRRDETIDCHWGEYRMGGRLLHDVHPYGLLSLTDVLVKSSNIGMAQIGERLGNAGLYEVMQRFGFGWPTGIDLPGEAAGTVRPLGEWTSYSTGSVPMGQEIAVTPLQLIRGYGAITRGGTLPEVRLVREVLDGVQRSGSRVQGSASDANRPNGEPRPPSPLYRWMVEEVLREVVRRGTGRRADVPGYEVFGKSGTAQVADPRTGRYSSALHVSSFIAGAPAHDPRVLVLVVVNEPSVPGTHYGGTVAAPAAAAILRQTLVYLGVPATSENPTGASE